MVEKARFLVHESSVSSGGVSYFISNQNIFLLLHIYTKNSKQRQKPSHIQTICILNLSFSELIQNVGRLVIYSLNLYWWVKFIRPSSIPEYMAIPTPSGEPWQTSSYCFTTTIPKQKLNLSASTNPNKSLKHLRRAIGYGQFILNTGVIYQCLMAMTIITADRLMCILLGILYLIYWFYWIY